MSYTAYEAWAWTWRESGGEKYIILVFEEPSKKPITLCKTPRWHSFGTDTQEDIVALCQDQARLHLDNGPNGTGRPEQVKNPPVAGATLKENAQKSRGALCLQSNVQCACHPVLLGQRLAVGQNTLHLCRHEHKPSLWLVPTEECLLERTWEACSPLVDSSQRGLAFVHSQMPGSQAQTYF